MPPKKPAAQEASTVLIRNHFPNNVQQLLVFRDVLKDQVAVWVVRLVAERLLKLVEFRLEFDLAAGKQVVLGLLLLGGWPGDTDSAGPCNRSPTRSVSPKLTFGSLRGATLRTRH